MSGRVTVFAIVMRMNSEMLAQNDYSESYSDRGSPVPAIGSDLVAAEAQGYFKGMQADRVMAALELLRHGEVSLEQAAGLSGLSSEALMQLLGRLPVSGFRL